MLGSGADVWDATPLCGKERFCQAQSLARADRDVGIIDIDGFAGEDIGEGLVIGDDFVRVAADQAEAPFEFVTDLHTGAKAQAQPLAVAGRNRVLVEALLAHADIAKEAKAVEPVETLLHIYHPRLLQLLRLRLQSRLSTLQV